jgi:archaellum component FlaC
MRYLVGLMFFMLGNGFQMFGMEGGMLMEAQPTAPAQPTATVPSAPLTWQDQAAALKEVEVTTINEERGNWVVKAKVLKDAKRVFDLIQKKALAVQPVQEKYLAERTALDTTMNAFYNDYGFQRGEIDERLDVINEDLKPLESTKSALDDQERLIRDEAKRKREALEDLKKNFDYLQKLEDALSQSLITMSAQIHKVNSFVDQSWVNYEKIGDVLNDEVAQDLLGKMHVMLDNASAIEAYLTGELRNFFTNTIQKTTAQVELVKNKIIALKDEGIALGKKMKALQDQEELVRLSQEKQACDVRLQKQEVAARTWFSPVFDAFSWIWEGIKSFFGYAYDITFGWFVTKEVKKPEQIPLQPTVPQVESMQPITSTLPKDIIEPEQEEVVTSVPATPESVMPEEPAQAETKEDAMESLVE